LNSTGDGMSECIVEADSTVNDDDDEMEMDFGKILTCE